MDFTRQSNMARVNSDLRAELVRLKKSVIEIRKKQVAEDNLNGSLLVKQCAEIQRLRDALQEILDHPLSLSSYDIAKRALAEEV